MTMEKNIFVIVMSKSVCSGTSRPTGQRYRKDRRKLFWTLIIGFEEEQGFRKASGSYLRKN